MVMPLEPHRGGFLRPFGTAVFIRDFLAGEGPKYGVARIDPAKGAPQQDIHSSYKLALHLAMAEDAAAWDAEEAIRRGEPMTPEQVEERRNYYLQRIPYKLTRMRYHSFLTYFGMLKRLGWVEPTGEAEEPSETQEAMALKADEPPRETGQPRIYYRLTDRGRAATMVQLSNPLRLLYPHFTAEYFREARKAKRYYPRRQR
jgi:hypothetical protein